MICCLLLWNLCIHKYNIIVNIVCNIHSLCAELAIVSCVTHVCLPGRNSLVNEVGFLGLTYYQKVVRTNETVALPLQKRNFNLYFEDLYRFQMGFAVIFFKAVDTVAKVYACTTWFTRPFFLVKRWGHYRTLWGWAWASVHVFSHSARSRISQTQAHFNYTHCFVCSNWHNRLELYYLPSSFSEVVSSISPAHTNITLFTTC